jgi:hypothetical protein
MQVTGVVVAAGAVGQRFELEFQVAAGSLLHEPLLSRHGTRFEEGAGRLLEVGTCGVAPFRVLGSPELQRVTAALGELLLRASKA